MQSDGWQVQLAAPFARGKCSLMARGVVALASTAVLLQAQAPTSSGESAASGGRICGQRILRKLTAVELSRFDVCLKPPVKTPTFSYGDALQVARELVPGQKVLEAAPALVHTSRGGGWAADWVVSLQPYSGLRPVPLSPGHPIWNQLKNRRPYLIAFVNSRTGRYDGMVYQFWRGMYWRYPCSYVPFHPTAYVRASGKWRPAPTVLDKSTGERDPVLRVGQSVMLTITVSPAACQDRFSRVRLYFRRSYVGSNGVTQFRNWVGHGAWLHGVRAGNSWRFMRQFRFAFHPVSHLVLAAWNITTASDTFTPDMLIHVREVGHKGS